MCCHISVFEVFQRKFECKVDLDMEFNTTLFKLGSSPLKWNLSSWKNIPTTNALPWPSQPNVLQGAILTTMLATRNFSGNYKSFCSYASCVALECFDWIVIIIYYQHLVDSLSLMKKEVLLERRPEFKGCDCPKEPNDDMRLRGWTSRAAGNIHQQLETQLWSVYEES